LTYLFEILDEYSNNNKKKRLKIKECFNIRF
jgi:hypothetical protein